MYTYQRIVRMQDTDTTGVLYFANQHQMALEAFEEFLRSKGFSLHELISNGDYLLPIVHSEADFMAPMFIADEITVKLQLAKFGAKSFTLATEFYKEKTLVGTAKIVHVVLSKKNFESIPIPNELINLFS